MKDNTLYIAGAVGLVALGVGLYFLTKNTEAVEPPPTKFTCPYCGATFNTYLELLDHIAKEHPEQSPDWIEKAATAAALAQEALDKAQDAEEISDLDSKTDALILAIQAYDEVYNNYQQYLTDSAKQDLTAAASLINSVSSQVKTAWTTLLEDYKNSASIATQQAEIAWGVWNDYNKKISDVLNYTGWVVTLDEKPYFRSLSEGGHASRLPMGAYPDFNDPAMFQFAYPGCDPVRNNELSSISVNAYYRIQVFDKTNFQVLLLDAHSPYTQPDVPFADQAESCKVLPYTDELEAERSAVRIEVVDAVSSANVLIESVNRITGDLRLYNLIASAINSAITLTNSLSARIDALVLS